MREFTEPGVGDTSDSPARHDWSKDAVYGEHLPAQDRMPDDRLIAAFDAAIPGVTDKVLVQVLRVIRDADPELMRCILELGGWDVREGRTILNPLDVPGYFHVKVAPGGQMPPFHGHDVLVARPLGDAPMTGRHGRGKT